MRGEDGHLVAVLLTKLAQAAVIVQPGALDRLHAALEPLQRRRAVRCDGVDLAVEEVRVAGIEQPAAAGVDGDPGVPARVPGERHQQDLGRQAVELPHGLETEPRLAGVRIGRPLWTMSELDRAVAAAFRRVTRGLKRAL